MLLRDKNAVIYGGGGAIGGAVARAFAREGANLFLAGRTLATLDRVAEEISAAGGIAETAEVDALDESAVADHAEAVASRAGGIDVALNAVGILHVQGPPLAELSFEDYAHPITAYSRTNFLTAKAVARHMVERRSGVILTLSTPGSRMTGQGFLGYGVTCAAIEAFSRILAGELGPSGIRVVCLRPHAIPEAAATSHTGEVFSDPVPPSTRCWPSGPAAARCWDAFPPSPRSPTSPRSPPPNRAGALTGAIANLSSGALVD
jgi:3-oxoacyl-[acyl-carrier protein] reductase